MLALIPLFPLLGFLINGLWYAFGQTGGTGHDAHSSSHSSAHGHGPSALTSAKITGGIASLAIFLSFVVSLCLFFQLHGMEPEHRVIDQVLFSWMQVGSLHLDVAFRVDSLSTLFTLVITGVGTLIHIYSIGYMSHDESPGKFFCYLNLFCFAMLVLVLGASLPMMFLGWEGVGLCSYLLIGYWYTDTEKAKAGMKAFIVNRIGDFGFLLGMFLIFWVFGTLDFSALQAASIHGIQGLPVDASPEIITAICLLLFVGCMGKSAQIPLYVWLPDAMAGPTPVSALIHAATMVTSGIYLVSRLNFFYSMSETASHVVAVVGVCTAFFAASIALVQNDIKKILAYSTVSQLGYMFLGCGVGAYSAGVFHVITHAFFKALLFLGAGSVIHGMHEEQDIWKMGGLRSKMPKTFLVFAIAWLAICGIPPFSGFFSKDEILWQAFSSPHGSVFLWGLGAITALMTAFYMTRLFSLTFLGSFRSDHLAHHEVHESPPVMVVPLQILAVLSALGGFIGIPHLSWLEHWLEPVVGGHADLISSSTSTASGGMEWIMMGESIFLAAMGIYGAFRLYQNLERVHELGRKFAVIHRVLTQKWYIDEIYHALFVRPIMGLSKLLWKYFDMGVIDRTVVGFGSISVWTGRAMRVTQTGSTQFYALILLLGLVITAGYLIYG